MANREKNFGLVPSLLSDSFLPLFLRNFPFPEEKGSGEMMNYDTSNITMWEDDSHVFLEVAAPGVKKDQIEISFDKGIIWIKGSREEEKKDDKRKYYCKASRSFSYRIGIPGEIDESKEPTAEYIDGMVRITFNKQRAETPKKIQIKK